MTPEELDGTRRLLKAGGVASVALTNALMAHIDEQEKIIGRLQYLVNSDKERIMSDAYKDEDRGRCYSPDEGIRAIIQLQALVGIDEPYEDAEKGWNEMSQCDRELTTATHLALFGGANHVDRDKTP